MQELAASIPSRFALSDWRLLYSTHVHGISLNTFNACMQSPETKSFVLADITEGVKADIQGTPAVFINGLKTEPELDAWW